MSESNHRWGTFILNYNHGKIKLMQRILGLLLLSFFLGESLLSQTREAMIIRTYDVPSSRQGVAVDSSYFYVINNSSISKHHKGDGRMVEFWEDEDSLIHHLNSGIIIDEKLYVVNSNYPEFPMASSIEIFDPMTLEHINNHSFGILNGSATWLDEHDGYWFVAFAHYTGKGSEPGKSNSWTRLVKFDREWKQLESWIFPKELINKFESRSNSGGLILPDGRVLCTGHDNYEVYLLEFPNKGYSLKWVDTLPIGSFGQGIAYEKVGQSEYIYGVIKKENKVVVSKIDLSNGSKTQSSNVGKNIPQTVLKLEPSDMNPRNSEGDFIKLNDGRILFIYSHFTGGDGDHASAFLAGRYSDDEGENWSNKDNTICSNTSGLNLMSVSLLRLMNGDIALFYLRKNSLTDCLPILRISKDEGNTWGEEIECINDHIGYYVLNNDRVIQLNNGRLLVPVSKHAAPDMEWSNTGRIQTYYSEDNGRSWKAGNLVANPDEMTLQEPGVVALKDGRILMFMRNNSGFQYISFSSDQGKSWSPAEPSTIKSPLSPASIERIPVTGDLLMVWNNNGGENKAIAGKRTPFNIGISNDEGKTWQVIRTLADDPDGWYCYTAIEFAGEHVLLGHSAGNRKENNGLAVTQISRINLDWIYGKQGKSR